MLTLNTSTVDMNAYCRVWSMNCSGMQHFRVHKMSGVTKMLFVCFSIDHILEAQKVYVKIMFEITPLWRYHPKGNIEVVTLVKCKTRVGHVAPQLSLLLALQWRHNDHDGVSNHQPDHCLLNCLFGRRSKKTSKLRVTGLCVENSPGTSEFPAQMASNTGNVSIWWRHHANQVLCSAAKSGTHSKITLISNLRVPDFHIICSDLN